MQRASLLHRQRAAAAPIGLVGRHLVARPRLTRYCARAGCDIRPDRRCAAAGRGVPAESLTLSLTLTLSFTLTPTLTLSLTMTLALTLTPNLTPTPDPIP